MAECEFFVSGEPATFATRAEGPWKLAIEGQAQRPGTGGHETAIRLELTVSTPARSGKVFDLDNLCEPLLEVLIGKLGWFRAADPTSGPST